MRVRKVMCNVKKIKVMQLQGPYQSKTDKCYDLEKQNL